MKTNRRHFLTTSSASLAAPFFTPGLSMANPANSKLSHAIVGVGGMQGNNDLQSFASHQKFNVTVLCDLDKNELAKAAAKFPDARKYSDYREMLAAEGDKIDSVSITIPDHSHAPVAYAAMAAKKHVYCQKPLTHSIHEARALRLAAEKHGVVTQMGNQIQSSLEYRSAVELIQRGAIGKIKEVHAWCGAVYTGTGRPAQTTPAPDTLDWNLWLGTAPERPFSPGHYHTVQWRCWQDFGGGCMGDFGCHILDTPFKALELSQPISVKNVAIDKTWRENPAAFKENWPAAETHEFLFPGTQYTANDTIQVTWYDGAHTPDPSLFPFSDDEPKSIPGNGSLFIGETGTIVLPHVGGPRFIPREANRGVDRPKLKPRSHYHAFIDACLGGEQTTSNFGFAANLTESVLLGTVACRFPDQELKWDAKALKITNADAANAHVRKSYRDGFSVPGLG